MRRGPMNLMSSRAFGALTFLAVLGTTGCRRADVPGAPSIRYGSDRCAVCDMVINDESCAAGLSVRTKSGAEFRLFDDLGEMFDFEESDEALPVLARFVHDYSGKNWIPADTARYVVGESIRTPMSSGIVALADPAAAKALAEKTGGRAMTLEEARLARQLWREKHAGS